MTATLTLTVVGLDLVVLVQQKVLGRLWAEGKGDQLYDGRDSGEDEQPRPAGLVAEDVGHAEHLGQEDGDGDDELVDGADLGQCTCTFVHTECI